MIERIIGIISDTHGLFDPKIPAVFRGVSHILHAGDIGNLQVLSRLRALAPVTAVSGNMDEGCMPPELKPEMSIHLYGIQILMLHVLGDPSCLNSILRHRIERMRPNVVVFGHSHKPFLEKLDGCLYFNPGSAGPKRFSLPRSVGLMTIRAGDCEGKIIEI